VIGLLGAAALSAFAFVSLALALQAADRRGVLERAGWMPVASGGFPRVPVRADALIVPAVVLAWIAGVRIGGVVLGLAAAVAVAVVPWLGRRRRDAARDRAAQEQLAEGVGVIASGLRSGLSLARSIELASGELAPPLGPSFRRAADRIALGEPLEAAIDSWAVEVGGPDVRVTAGVLRLHRRTGGGLATALDGLASTLRARRSAARELRSLTAQARLSATILGLLPIGFFVFLSVVAREDLRLAFGTPVGSGAVILGFTLQALAYLWIRHLLRVEP
jgi:tight adherence protein B